MPTVLVLLDQAMHFLQHRQVQQPRSDAEWILADVLGCRRCDLYTLLEKSVDQVAVSEFRTLVGRRGRREPLQYILEVSDFYNVSLRNDGRALIPRPETEELVEFIVDVWKKKAPSHVRILDLGTGSGAIGIALAKALPESEVMAIDIDSNALKLALENAESNCVSNISFRLSDWFENVEGCFDLVVANPPYLTQEEVRGAEPEVRDYEPIGALCSDQGGIADLLKILRQAWVFMTSGASLILEMGSNHGNLLKEEALKLGFCPVQIRRDVSGRPRFLIADRGTGVPLEP
ncbi:MAG: peptide chain release factor N(5)-glutamine methyltransferase [Puniceicoccales bacterium]|jgi:release factor glutamine methyltransferase|nr:peptide chain release factor N(5)-glutamine methyltransferase [Puniceicoccales bacterium]